MSFPLLSFLSLAFLFFQSFLCLWLFGLRPAVVCHLGAPLSPLSCVAAFWRSDLFGVSPLLLSRPFLLSFGGFGPI